MKIILLITLVSTINISFASEETGFFENIKNYMNTFFHSSIKTFQEDEKVENKIKVSHEDGTIEIYLLINGLKHGQAQKEYSNGDILNFTYHHGFAHGEATLQFSGGEKLRFHYENGERNGRALYTCDNYDEFFTYQNGVEQGAVRFIFKDGTRQTAKYIDGALQGKSDFEFPDGWSAQVMLVDGIGQGFAKKISPNGLTILRYYLKDGKQHGPAMITELEEVFIYDNVNYDELFIAGDFEVLSKLSTVKSIFEYENGEEIK